MMAKNNLPPARGLGNSDSNEVYCISCSEADTDSVKFGTPKNPLSFNE